ncbi:MAG: transporter associated domain-containing protein [Bacteroidia bacterium]
MYIKLEIPEGEYDTLGGYLINDYHSIPEEGDEIEVDRFTFKILGTEGAKINDIHLYVKPNEQ